MTIATGAKKPSSVSSLQFTHPTSLEIIIIEISLSQCYKFFVEESTLHSEDLGLISLSH